MKKDGTRLKRVFFPETKTLIVRREYSNPIDLKIPLTSEVEEKSIMTKNFPSEDLLLCQTPNSQYIPRTFLETYAVLNLISSNRKGSQNNTFSVIALRQIATNLNIPNTGNKVELSQRITSRVKKYFDLPF